MQKLTKSLWVAALTVTSLLHAGTPIVECNLMIQATVVFDDGDKEKIRQLSGGRTEYSGASTSRKLGNKEFLQAFIDSGVLTGVVKDWRLVLRFLVQDFEGEPAADGIFLLEAVRNRTGERVGLGDYFRFEMLAATDLTYKELFQGEEALSATGKLTGVARVGLLFPEYDAELDETQNFWLDTLCLFNSSYKYGPVRLPGESEPVFLQILGASNLAGHGTVTEGESEKPMDDTVLSLRMTGAAGKVVVLPDDLP
jgi:hypothetical protein